jgi:protein-tyrosine phosphatase
VAADQEHVASADAVASGFGRRLRRSSPARMFDEITEVDDAGRLFLSGSIEDWKPVHDLGITVVIDLDGDIDHGVPTAADAFLYVYLPIHDGDLPNIARLHAVARLGASLVASGHRVLSHCGMGLNRSALVAGLILMTQGMTGPQVVAQLRQRRTGALFNEVFARYLLDLDSFQP